MDPQETPKQASEAKLDRKSKILFIVIAILIIGSIVATYWRIVFKKDYIVQAQIDCDPESENCFVWECDPNSKVEGESCTGDEESDIWYYKNFFRNAKNIPLCDPSKDENCTAYVCDPGEKDCSEELCTDENVPEGEACNDPEQYLIDNPPEEECAEDDEECLVAEEECEPDDQECLDAQNEEEACAPDDEECLAAQNQDSTCSPDDPTCIQESSAETAPDADAIPEPL